MKEILPWPMFYTQVILTARSLGVKEGAVYGLAIFFSQLSKLDPVGGAYWVASLAAFRLRSF